MLSIECMENSLLLPSSPKIRRRTSVQRRGTLIADQQYLALTCTLVKAFGFELSRHHRK